MIDLIIPAYNAHETISKTLISVCLQTCKELINVIIVDDASQKDYSDEVELFSKKINIRQITNKINSGPAISRQVGIDNSSSDYIMFLDADDLLYDCFSISNALKVMANSEYDIFSGIVVFEEDNKNTIYNDHFGCLHGKIFRRTFLSENKFKFSKYRIHEDNSFCQVLLMANPKIIYSNDYIYLYKKNPKSVTRKENIEYKSAFEYIDNMMWALSEAEKRNFSRINISKFLLNSLAYIYSIYCHYYHWENVQDLLVAAIPLYKKDLEYYDISVEDFRLKVLLYFAERYKYFINFAQFQKKIEEQIQLTELIENKKED